MWYLGIGQGVVHNGLRILRDWATASLGVGEFAVADMPVNKVRVQLTEAAARRWRCVRPSNPATTSCESGRYLIAGAVTGWSCFL